MTTNSTKYFCNRGALSDRFILVDTPLRGEYYYDGEHGKYYFGARYFDPFFGMWLSPDPAAQFANPYTYGGDPLNYVDPNGEFVNLAFGAAIGAIISGGTYAATVALTDKEWKWGEFGKNVAIGAIGGAISGGFSSLGTSISTNMAYGTLGNMTSYSLTSGIFEDGPTTSGYVGATIGGITGGLIPGYTGVQGGAAINIGSEIAYSATKGAAVGAFSGGISGVIETQSFEGFKQGAYYGAMYGAIGGATGAAVKIGMMGYATPKSQYQMEVEQRYARDKGIDVGDYGSVNRSGGLIAWGNKTYASIYKSLTGRNLGKDGGVTIGRNLLSWTDNEKSSRTETIPAHESIHYLQQIENGYGAFYLNTASDYLKYGSDVYYMQGSYENTADFYSDDHFLVNSENPHPGYRW
jgi:RHS repeat-associated protein